MKIYPFLQAIVTLFAVCVPTLRAQTQATDNSLLWKISGNGLKQPSYLYGTIHMICPQDLEIKPRVRKALESARRVTFEIDLSDPNAMASMAQTMLRKDSAGIKSFFTPEEYKSLETFVRDSLGFSLPMIENANPMVLSLILLPKLMDCVPASTEERLIKLIENKGKTSKSAVEIAGLETVEEQLGFLQSVPTREQAGEVMKMIQDFGAMKIKIREVSALYKTENIDGLQTLLREMPGEMSETLVTKRNAAWIPKMERQMRDKATFFAVGAGHLAGAGGVIALLKKQGYTLEAVKK